MVIADVIFDVIAQCKRALTKYAIILRKNVSQKSDKISMVSNLVHFFVNNQYLSLKILDLQKKLTGKPVINSVFL